MVHFTKAPVLPMVLALSLTAAFLQAEDTEGTKEDLQEGIALFSNGLYDKAIIVFRNVILASDASDAQKGSAYFWTGKSYMALGKLEDAERNLEHYISGNPTGPDYPEALYQKARLLFMQEEYESSIQAMQGFISAYPKSPLIANGYFWVAECLYNLGKLDEAIAVYRKIVSDYPTSAKVEAAQYRLSLVDLSKREEELTKLLKWSHEDFLKSISEYQRREKTYEQAIDAYQKKLSSQTPSDKAVSDLKAELESKAAEVNRLTAQIQELKAQPTVSSAESSAAKEAMDAQLQELAKQKDAVDRTLRLLALKGQALALKETYLQWLETNGGGR